METVAQVRHCSMRAAFVSKGCCLALQLQALLTNLLEGIFQLKSPDVTRYLELGSFYWPEQEICEIQKAF